MHLQSSYLRYIYKILVDKDENLLARKYRLQGKEVMFLSRKRQYFSSGYFGFFYFKQYSNLAYNQFSCHISIKVSKRSTKRNVIKRAVMNYIGQQQLIQTPIKNQLYKFFIVLHKPNIAQFQSKLANLTKKDKIICIQSEFATAWKACTMRII